MEGIIIMLWDYYNSFNISENLEIKICVNVSFWIEEQPTISQCYTFARNQNVFVSILQNVSCLEK